MEHKDLTQLDGNANQQDLINATQIFGRALAMLFEDKEGIVVDVVGDIKLENASKVLVYKLDNEINIMRCEQDIPNGTTIKLVDEPTDTE